MASTDKSKKIMTLDNLTYYDGKIKGYINGKYVEVKADLSKLEEEIDRIKVETISTSDELILQSNG